MRRSASEVIKNLEVRIARLENKSAGWGNDIPFDARVVTVDGMDYEDFKKSVSSVSDLQKIFDYCEKKMRTQIIAEGKIPIDFDLSWIGDNVFVFQCLMNFEGESGHRRDSGMKVYQIEIREAGIASLIMKNPSFFKKIRSIE